MKSLVYSLVLFSLMFSCGIKNVENKKEFKLIKNHTFYSGFNSSNSQVETFGGKQYYCVGDFLSYKKIAVHGLTDSSLHFVNLKTITDLGEKVISYEIVNLDSIYILTDHTNKVFLINNKGEIQKKYDFNTDTLINKKFMLMRCLTPFVFNKSTFVFGLSYRSQNREYDFNNLEEFQLKKYKAPILYKVTKGRDAIKTELGLENLYLNFLST